jgi:shikimate kinase|eukprot:COSAG02_NODE_2274_length_9257_cov_21.945840_7_plen_281_part_00
MGITQQHRLATCAGAALAVVGACSIATLCANRRLRTVLRAVRPEAAETADRQNVEAWAKRQGPRVVETDGHQESKTGAVPATRGGGSAKRIIIGGMMGSGKTTLAKELSNLLQLPHIPVDELYHLEGATEAGEWKESEMDMELRRRMDAAIALSGGWIVEANPWQVPTWVWDDLGTEVIWLDYDNMVNYVRLMGRAARTWWTGQTATHDEAQDLTASFWSQVTNCAELMMIVYRWGAENRSGWRSEERFCPPRALRFTTPAELQLWTASVRAALTADEEH